MKKPKPYTKGSIKQEVLSIKQEVLSIKQEVLSIEQEVLSYDCGCVVQQ
jgi:hypothetical protein